MTQRQAAARAAAAVVVLLLVVTLRPGTAEAVGNLRLGSLELHPFFQITQLFEDNVLRVNEDLFDPESDQVTIFSPGLAATLPLGRHRFDAEYRLDIGRYNEVTEDNYEDHLVTLHLGMSMAEGVSADLEDRFVDGHDERQENQNAELDLFRSNEFDANAGWAGANVTLGVGYENFFKDYGNESCPEGVSGCNDFRDYDANTIGARLGLKLMPKSQLFAQYNFTMTRHPDAEELDSDTNRIYGGIGWQITARSKGEVKAGYAMRSFDQEGVQTVGDTGQIVDLQDFSGGVYGASLRHEFGPRTSLWIDGERDTRETNIASQSYYVSTRLDTRLRQVVRSRFAIDLLLGWVRDAYPDDITVADPDTGATETGERVDDTLRAMIGLDVTVTSWLNIGGGYTHLNRSSEFELFEFTDNIISLYARAVL